tara:strand:+ start:8473 stop:10560 length:2088 start_codon:yes stop_codon:yes gene_type:complete
MAESILRVVSPADLAEQERLANESPTGEDGEKKEFSQLVAFIRREFQSARDARYKSGVSGRLVEALRTYRAEYSAEKLSQITQFGGSTAYSRVTATKCRGATAVLRDLYLSASDEPWILKPTPVPTIPEDITDKLAQMVFSEVTQLQEAGAQITEEMIQERVDQLNVQAEQYAVKVAVEEAAKGTKHLNDILIEGGFYKAMREFLIDMPIFPIAVIKGPVVVNVASTKWVDGVAQTVYKPQMQWKRVSPMDVYFTPDAGTVEQSYVIEHVKFSQQDLVSMIDVPGFDGDAIREVLDSWDKDSQSTEWRGWFETERENLEARDYWTTRGKLVDAIEYHGVVQAKMLAEYGVIPEKEEYDSAEIYMVDAWLIDDKILKVQINPALTMRPPYYITSFEKIPGSIYGYGLPDILRDIQDVCSSTMRSLVNNVSISSGPQVVVNDDRLAPGETGNELYPWKRWHTQDHPDGNKGQAAISFFQPQSNAQELLAIYEKFSQMADEASALPRYMTGGQAGGAGRTASGLAMLMDNASKVMQNVAANVDDDILSPGISSLYDMVMLTQGDSNVLRGDETVQVRGVTVAVQRETDRMRKLEFLQMTMNPMDMEIIGVEGRAEVLREVSDDLGMNGSKIVPSSADMQQKSKIQQAQQQEAAQQQQVESASNAGAKEGSVKGAIQAPRSPAMEARQPQENVTRGIVQ